MPRILVLYYSSYGHLAKMADAMIEGMTLREAGAEMGMEEGLENLAFTQTTFSPDDEPAVPDEDEEPD